MNLQMEINSLKQRIAELEEQVKGEWEFPQSGERYWCISGSWVNSFFWKSEQLDLDRYRIGNIFKTEEQAEFAVEKLKVEAELRKYSRPFEYGKFNHYLFLDIDGDSFRTDFTSYCPPQGAIYFESEEKAQEAVSTVGKERVKKYIFGVEDL